VSLTRLTHARLPGEILMASAESYTIMREADWLQSLALAMPTTLACTMEWRIRSSSVIFAQSSRVLRSGFGGAGGG